MFHGVIQPNVTPPPTARDPPLVAHYATGWEYSLSLEWTRRVPHPIAYFATVGIFDFQHRSPQAAKRRQITAHGVSRGSHRFLPPAPQGRKIRPRDCGIQSPPRPPRPSSCAHLTPSFKVRVGLFRTETSSRKAATNYRPRRKPWVTSVFHRQPRRGER